MPLKDYTFETPEWGIGSKSLRIIAVSKKDETRYQLKWLKDAPYPFGADPTTARTKRKKRECEELFKFRTRINNDLMAADGKSGQLAFATEVFLNLDEERPGVIEAVPFVEGARDYEFIRKNDIRIKKALFSMAEALERLHSHNIVHGDIKRENIILSAAGAFGNTIRAKLIDFDSSYYENELPPLEKIGGTPGYVSPEVDIYIYNDEYEDEEEEEKLRRRITRARDIFSLGVVFCELLTGKGPSRIDNRIIPDRTKINKEYLYQLIQAMLEVDPEDRPTAEEVVEILNNESMVFSREPYEELWPEHLALYTYNMARFSYVKKIRRLEDAGSHRYVIHYSGGEKRDYNVQMLARIGLVKKRAYDDKAVTEFEQNGRLYEADLLWPEHENYQIDYEMLRRRGFGGFYRVKSGEQKGYAVYKPGIGYLDRSFIVLTFEKCIVQKEK